MKNQTFIALFFLILILSCKKEKLTELGYDYEIKSVSLYNQKEVDSFGLTLEPYNRVKIGSELRIVDDSIKTLAPLKNKVKNVSYLYIAGTSLQTLDGIDSIEVIYMFDLIGNSKLDRFSVEMSDKFIKMIQIVNNEKLENLNGLNNVKEIGRLYLADNESLKNLEGLESLTNAGSIILRNNDSLYSLDGIESIEGGTKYEYVKIEANNNLNLIDFCSLTTLALNDKLEFYAFENFYNPELEDIKLGDCKLE